MNRRQFIKRSSGIFVPVTFGIFVPKLIRAQQHAPHRRKHHQPPAPVGGSSTVIQFDGVDDMITLSGMDMSADTTYSVSFWIRPENLTGSWQALLIQTANDRGFWLRASGLCLCLDSIGGFYNNNALSINTWYHMCFANNAGSWQWYRNGVADGSGATATGTAAIANRIGGKPSDPFSGRLSQFAVFSDALTGTEAGNLANKSILPTDLDNLLAYWELDDVANGASGNGVSFIDTSGNGHTGTGDDGANNSGLTGATLDY